MNDILAWPAAFYTGTSCLRCTDMGSTNDVIKEQINLIFLTITINLILF